MLEKDDILDGVIQIRVIPNAKKTEIIEKMADGYWKMKVKAIPEKWKANKEIIRFLSENLQVSKKNIGIISGTTSSLKKIKISL